MKMKTIPILILLALSVILAAPHVHATQEVTGADVARHLGIHFWKFDTKSLPPRFSVALLEIQNGQVIGTYLSAMSSPEPGDLVIGMESRAGKVEATISVGTSLLGLGALPRKEIGISAKLNPKEVLIGTPIVIAADYRPSGGKIMISGKVEDVVSGLALLINEEK